MRFNFTPTFSTRPDLEYDTVDIVDILRRRSPNRFSKMAPRKPEVEITIDRNEMATRFQRLPNICDHAGTFLHFYITDFS